MVEMSVLQEEQRTLRSELAQLKGCQLQYFTLSITGTAAVFSLAAIGSQNAALGVACLAPLAIILPCWLIFFDKATTITRVVGYCRLVERMIATHPSPTVDFIGYETALALYRYEEDRGGRKEMDDERRASKAGSTPQEEVKVTSIRHRYWLINWYTYVTLSAVCCFLSLGFLLAGPASWWWFLVPLGSLVLISASALFTHNLLVALMKGDYSYSRNHDFWVYIHNKYAPRRPVT
jgi:hypothetical protein